MHRQRDFLSLVVIAAAVVAPAWGQIGVAAAGPTNVQTAASIPAITLSGSPVSRLGDADDERRQAKRNSLADKLTVEAKVLANLKIEKAAVEGERRKVEADLGPVRYLATLLGAGDQDVLRWFILVVALLLDPAAVLLLLAATRVL
jgi:hypothetical protein